MPQRIDLDAQLKASRTSIDADWSGRKKAVVGSAAGLLAAVALGFGVWTFVSNRPPKLPTTAQEAVMVLASSSFEKLDGERKNDLRMEAVRLLREAPEEERRELFTQFTDPEVRRQIGEAFMEDMARQFARTGEFTSPWGAMPMGRPGGSGGPGGRPGGEGRPGEGGPGGGGGGGEGDRQGRGEGNNADRRAQFANRILDRMSNGDAQTTALMGEFFRAMRAQREQAQRGGGGG